MLGPYLGADTPEHTVRINGIEYARVYRGPHYPASAEPWSRLRRPGHAGARTWWRRAAATSARARRSTVGLRWDRATAAQERVIVAILGPDGQAMVQDERQVGEDGRTSAGSPAISTG